MLRLAKTDTVAWRNNANGADLALAIDGSDNLTFNGTKVGLSGNIVNADINASAAIAYSKLALTGAILNADLAGSIAYSKLTLTGSIVNADVSASAAIAYSKLNLAGAVKLASDVTGLLPAANGGTGVLSTATFPSSGVVVTEAGTETLTNKTLTSPVISTIVNTGTLTLPTSTDTLVGRATTDTLTNKTLTSPVIGTIVNTGTLTLPTSTDTLVGRATTDTLTNKTISGGTHTGITSLGIRDTSAAFDVTHAHTSSTTITAGRTLTFDVQNQSSTIKTVPLSNFSTLTDGSAGQVLTTLGSSSGYQWAAALTTTMSQNNTFVGNGSNVATATNTSLLGDATASTASATVTMTIAAPGVVTWTGHGLSTYDKVYFTTSASGLPTGVTASTTYWVTVVDANTFKLSDTLAHAVAGTFVTTSGTQSGTHTGFAGGLKVVDAGTAARGLLNTTTQSVSGVKTFVDAMGVGSGLHNIRGIFVFGPGTVAGSTTQTLTISIPTPGTGVQWVLWGQILTGTTSENQNWNVMASGTGSTISLDKTRSVAGSGSASISFSGGTFLWTLTGTAGTPTSSSCNAVFVLFAKN